MYGIKNIVPNVDKLNKLKRVYHTRVEDEFVKKFGTGIDNIKILKNVLPKDYLDKSLSLLKQFPVKNRDHCYSQWQNENWEHCDENWAFGLELTELLVSAAESAYKEDMLRDKPMLFMTHPTGSYILPHTDDLEIDYENNDPHTDSGPTMTEEAYDKTRNMWSGHLAILCYLNDDYEGGYLYFPEHDYYVKPEAGDVIMFPGSLYYVHGVSEVTRGVRYTLSQWAQFKFYNKNS